MTKSRTFIIGTRSSRLAAWQAGHVKQKLEAQDRPCTLKFIKTEGDQTPDIPLPMLGGRGVFTKALDDALLQGTIDLAVHSLKDVPTTIPEGLKIAAVLRREDPFDVLVTREGTDFLEDGDYEGVIATSSNRRRSQWLSRYPKHSITNIRGNVQTRLHKLSESNWDAAIFAMAGLKRLGLQRHADLKLGWMIPAPAQGALAVMAREDDERVKEAVKPLNHEETALCTQVERDFLFMMEAGCSAPVGAYASVTEDMVNLKAVALMPDGSRRFDIENAISIENARDLGVRTAEELLAQGADAVIEAIREGERK